MTKEPEVSVAEFAIKLRTRMVAGGYDEETQKDLKYEPKNMEETVALAIKQQSLPESILDNYFRLEKAQKEIKGKKTSLQSTYGDGQPEITQVKSASKEPKPDNAGSKEVKPTNTVEVKPLYKASGREIPERPGQNHPEDKRRNTYFGEGMIGIDRRVMTTRYCRHCQMWNHYKRNCSWLKYNRPCPVCDKCKRKGHLNQKI